MKGTYCLELFCKEALEIKVGSLGILPFNRGCYVYVGSALNNLGKRVKRHLSKEKSIYWHLDYILDNQNFSITKIYFLENPQKKECETASQLKRSGEPVKNFGSSDCSCTSHLFFWPENKIKIAESLLARLGFSKMVKKDIKNF